MDDLARCIRHVHAELDRLGGGLGMSGGKAKQECGGQKGAKGSAQNSFS
jgi:hypothetical protein